MNPQLQTNAPHNTHVYSADLIGCGQFDAAGAFGTCKAGADPECNDEFIGDGICDTVWDTTAVCIRIELLPLYYAKFKGYYMVKDVRRANFSDKNMHFFLFTM